MCAGLLLMAMLINGPVNISGYRFDIHTLLFASTFFIIGLQTVFFSVFAKIIAINAMKLPMGNKFELFLREFTLERGILVGLMVVLLGLIGSAEAVFQWMGTNFGTLMPGREMRIAIPSVTLLITGMQTIFSSFFLNLIITYNNYTRS